MHGGAEASASRGGFEAPACQAVQAIWDFEEGPEDERDEVLPIDHAAILETLLPIPLLAMAVSLASLLVRVAP